MATPSNRPPFLFCPWCAGPLSADEPFCQKCAACGFILYHNSSPCMGALPIDSAGRVLLGRRSIEPFRGAWNTIGGFLQYGEDPLEGLKREVLEETGVACDIKDFVAITADRYGEHGEALLNTYFTVRLHSPDVRPQDDVSELRWFALDALPDDIAFTSDRVALGQLKQKMPC